MTWVPNTIERDWVRGADVEVENLRGTAFTEEAGAHTFRITGRDASGAAFPLEGTVLAKVLRADNMTVDVDGDVGEDGVAELTLVGDCYNVAGRLQIVIYISDGTNSMAIYAAVGNVYRGTSGDELDSGSAVPSLQQLEAAYANAVQATSDANAAALAANTAAANVASNLAPTYSSSMTYAVGDYVIHDGVLYRCKTAIDTAEAWTAGHWEQVTAGNRIKNLDGAVKTHSRMLALEDPVTLPWEVTDAGYYVRYSDGEVYASDTYSVTGYVDVRGLVKIRYRMTGTTASSSTVGMAFYDIDGRYVDGVSTETSRSSAGYTEVYETAVPDNAAFARFSVFTDTETYGDFSVEGVNPTGAVINLLGGKTQTQTEYWLKGGLTGAMTAVSNASTTQKIAARIAATRMPKMPDGKVVFVNFGTGYTGRVAVYQRREFGNSSLIVKLTDDFTGGRVRIPNTYAGKYIGMDVRKISETEFTDEEVAAIGAGVLIEVTTPVGDLTELGTTHKDTLVEAINDKQDLLTFDTVPTSGGSNPVTSGGIYEMVDNLSKATTAEIGDSLSNYGKGRWAVEEGAVSYSVATSGTTYALQPVAVNPGEVYRIKMLSASGESVIFAHYENDVYSFVSSESHQLSDEIDAYYAVGDGVNRILLTKYGTRITPYCSLVLPKDRVISVTVSGADPVITGAENRRYVCGTCDTLTFTPPASGTVEVIFSSGSTATILSLPNTVRMPDWWTGVEANRTYDLIITDGVFGVVTSWAD